MGEHDSELSALIRTVRSRWRATSALRAWTFAAASAALVLGLALSAQRFAAPDGGPFIALWVAASVAVMVCLGWFVAPLRRAPGEHQVARYIEECCPELEDALVTAVVQGIAASRRAGPSSDPSRRAGPADPPSAMHAAVAADAVRRTRDLDLDRIVSRRTLRDVAIRAAAATLVLCAVAGFALEPAGRAARVLALYLFPGRLALDVVPGDARVREGEPLRIVVRIPGAVGGVVPVLRVGKSAGGGNAWREARMDAASDGFAAVFDHVAESFSYAVTAAGASSREYRVTVVRPPRVERIDLRYEYPPAFGMQPRQEEDGGDIYGPAGTRVHMVVHADKPVAQAALTLTGGQRVVLHSRGGVLEGDLTIVEDGSYRVALADSDGLANPGDTEYFIRTLEDRPPDVRIVRPAGDRKVTPIEEVPVEARADDDFGIAALDLVYAVRGAAPKTVPFQREGPATSASGRRTIYLEDLDVKPGDFVTYYARARDVSRGKRSTEARSDIFFLEITPFEEEFVAAQSQGAGGGGEQQFDDMVQAEKDIITATWKLDSRAKQSGARSDDDIRTVAKAQGDLRTKAMSSLGQMQRANNLRRIRPGGGRAAAATPADPAPDAMAKAADAMGRAEQQLGVLKTTDALPHEMTALNELLRSQSETRRREVQQQQASGNGRGSNRQQQDLSSLFDRELARQQQTNYETPTSRETREEKGDDTDATLDKIRDLARRQDELNTQQEQAARKQGAADEESRRQLERLTREQSELRKEAEELAQQLQQAENKQGQSGQSGRSGQAGQSGRSGQGGQSGDLDQNRQQGGRGRQSDQNRQQASRELQQISEEMQGAASELRRDNPQQASERGNRAAERLRDLEQRMRSTQPDDRRRAMGELQLESRELADAQRTLAAEGAARGRGGNTADASRRRAGEQDRLADRTGRLEQAVKQLAGASGIEERQRSALNEAARELDRQRLSDRMRNAARAERQAGEGRAGQAPQQSPQQSAQNSNAGREGQAIASALDQIAERLGSANGQSEASQQLSEQLSRIRELREKLTSLDRQLAEMKGNQPGGGQPQQGEGRAQRDGGSQPGAQSGRGQRGGSMQNGDSDQPWEEAKQLINELRHEKVSEAESPSADGFNPGRSAPGTEAWKQDFATWDLLKTQIAASLERAESSAAARLRDQQSKDQLSAGASQAVPEQYKRLVDKYYEALASKPREGK